MSGIEAAIEAAVDRRLAAWLPKFEQLIQKYQPPPPIEGIKIGQQETFNAVQAAKIMGCSAATVRKLIREGKLPCMTDGNRIYRIPRKVIEEYCKGGQI